MKTNHVKYLTSSEDDKNWGLFLNVTGSAKIDSDEIYPSANHPSEYFFNWNEGRILKEFQINYITEGEGVLENKFGKFVLKKGSIFIIFPNVWHRYKPLSKTGWTENYIGFNGSLVKNLISQPFFSARQPVFHPGIKEEFLDTYLKIFDIIDKEQPGFQQIASGMIIKLLGYIISFEKQKGFSGKRNLT